MKYLIRINTNLIRTIDVEADSEEEAKDLAFEELKQEINVQDENWKDECEFEVVQQPRRQKYE